MAELTEKAIQKLTELLDEECNYKLQPALMRQFLELGEFVDLRKGQEVSYIGGIDKNIYVLYDGIIRRCYMDGSNEVTAAFSMPGTLFLTYHGYYMNQSSPFQYKACCKSVLLKISKHDYDALIEESHEFARWSLSMAQCQLYFYEMKETTIVGTAAERYNTLVSKRPYIIQKVPLKIIASYLRITPEYLSFLRGKGV